VVTTFNIRFKSVMAGLRQSRKRYKASDYLRRHVARFNKSTPEMVKIDPKLNDFMMSRVVKRGSKVKVEISKTGDIINVKLAPGQVAAAPATQAKTPAASATAKQGAAAAAKPADRAQPKQQPKQDKPQEQKKQSSPPKPATPAQAGQQ
jgi:ribosomal protein L31E